METQQSGTELSNREFFIRRWTQEHPAFVDVCRALPSARLDYRPHPDSRSAGELVELLVNVEQSCLELCLTGRTSYASGMRWHTSTGLAPLEEMIAAYDAHHRALADKLNTLDDATWNYQAWLIRGEQEIILKDTVGGLLWIALFDAVHHRGGKSEFTKGHNYFSAGTSAVAAS